MTGLCKECNYFNYCQQFDSKDKSIIACSKFKSAQNADVFRDYNPDTDILLADHHNKEQGGWIILSEFDPDQKNWLWAISCELEGLTCGEAVYILEKLVTIAKSKPPTDQWQPLFIQEI